MDKPSNLFFLVAGVLSPVAVILSVGAGVFNYFPADLWFSQIIQSFADPGLTVFLKDLSWVFGDWHAAMLVIPVGLLIWWKAGFAEGLMVLLAGLISLIDEGLKLAVNRPRPTPELVNVMMSYYGSSFPSGHTFFAVMFLGVLTYLFFSHVRSTTWRVIILILAILIILLVGFARIYLGLHWASDILGGLVYGGLFLFLLIGMIPIIKSRNTFVKTG
jgi:membrane-associated phospholipid phosphatase